jgi:hypothetical protein
MKILNCRPAPSGGGNTLCHVDVEIVAGVKLFGLRVAQMPDQSFRVFGPNTDRGGRAMAFSAPVVNAIARATLKALEMDEPLQHERLHA